MSDDSMYKNIGLIFLVILIGCMGGIFAIVATSCTYTIQTIEPNATTSDEVPINP